MKYSLPILSIALLAFVGCSSNQKDASLSDTTNLYADIDISEPDFISVERFPVTIEEAKAVVSPSVTEAFGGQSQSEYEIEVGDTFADALQAEIVAQLKAKKISAYASQDAPDMTFKTALIRGFFFEEDEGDGELFGFGLADSDVTVRLIFFMEDVILGSTVLTTDTALKAHAAPKSPKLSKETRDAIEEGAKLAAEKVADEIHAAYVRRGWRK